MATKRGSSDPSRNYKRQKLEDEDLAEGCEKILDAPAFMNHLLLEILFANPDTRTHSNQVAKTFVRKFNTNILDEYYQTYGRQVFVVLDDAFLITHHFTNIERKVLLQLVIRFIVSTIESEVMAGQDINVMCDRVYRILTTKHNELYDLRVSLLEHVESLYDKNEVLGLRILEALLDICSLNSQASFNTIYKALQQLPSLCSSFYPELGPKKQTICRIVLFYFQKFVDGQLADSIVVEFVKLWNLIARAEYQYSKLNSGVMLNFVNEMGNEVTNYLLQFLVRPYLDKAFRNAVIEALCVMNKVHQIEDVVIPFILQNIEKQSERKEIAIRLAHSMISDDLLARNAENLPHFMQLLLNLLSDPSRRVRGQAFKVASLVFQLKCKVFETNKSLTISFMSEILNACQQGTPNSFKALAAFPISWFANLEGFESHSIIRLMLKNLLIGNVVNKTTESTKFKKRLTSICDAISSWSIHFPEILDEVIDSIISVLYKILQFPVPLRRTTVVPLKHQCMLYIATREQDLGSQFSVIPIDLMNELLNYKEIDDDIRFYYEKSLVSTISNILQNAATYEIQIHEIDRLWPKLKQISSSPRSEVNMEALRLAALLSSRWKSDKLPKYADECNTLLQSCKE